MTRRTFKRSIHFLSLALVPFKPIIHFLFSFFFFEFSTERTKKKRRKKRRVYKTFVNTFLYLGQRDFKSLSLPGRHHHHQSSSRSMLLFKFSLSTRRDLDEGLIHGDNGRAGVIKGFKL